MPRDARTATEAVETTMPPGVGSPSSRADADGAAPGPAGPATPIELDLAKGALLVLAVLALPTLGVAWLLADTAGLLGAAVALAVVAGMYAMSGAMLSWAARVGPEALLAAALGGFALRLMIYAMLIVLLEPVEAIHGPTLAVTAAVLLVITLAWEVRLVSRRPQLFWIDASRARPRPASTTRTSQQSS